MLKPLEKLLNKLYDTEWNVIYYTRELAEEIWIDEKYLHTPSIHKNYFEYDKLLIKLLPKWRNFIEEKRKIWYKKVVLHINSLSWFYTVLIAFFSLILSIIAIFSKYN